MMSRRKRRRRKTQTARLTPLAVFVCARSKSAARRRSAAYRSADKQVINRVLDTRLRSMGRQPHSTAPQRRPSGKRQTCFEEALLTSYAINPFFYGALCNTNKQLVVWQESLNYLSSIILFTLLKETIERF